MKALVLDENRQLVLRDMPRPEPSAENIVVATRAASICGTDIRTFLQGNPKVDAPRIMGHEFAGEIVHAGDYAASKGFSVGDRVTMAPAIGCGECWPCKTGHTNICDNLKTIGFQYEGTFAEYLSIPKQAIAMDNVITLPDDIDFDSATLIEPAACAMNGQSYMRIRKNDYVLIYGGGIIGCMHAELAFLQGAAKVLIAEPSEVRGRAAEKLVPGIIWLNSSACSVEDAVAKQTEGRGTNVVIVATSFPDVQLEAQKVAAKMARISLFGGLAGNSLGYIDSNLVHYKELQICGVHATTPGFMRDILQLMRDGRFNTKKYIDKTVTIDAVMDGFIAIRDESVMKVVIRF